MTKYLAAAVEKLIRSGMLMSDRPETLREVREEIDYIVHQHSELLSIGVDPVDPAATEDGCRRIVERAVERYKFEHAKR